MCSRAGVRNAATLSLLLSYLCPVFTANYMEEYTSFVFCPEGTQRMQDNAVSKASRAKAFTKYMMVGWDSTTYWTWEFLYNLPHLKA